MRSLIVLLAIVLNLTAVMSRQALAATCRESLGGVLGPAGAPAPAPASVATLAAGEAWLKGANGARVAARLERVAPVDAKQVAGWWDERSEDDPIYTDPKWRDWWVQHCLAPNPEVQVYKLFLANGRIAGLVALQEVVDPQDGLLMTKIQGIRVGPVFNREVTATPVATGVGVALVGFAAAQSLVRGTEGVGLNASLGAEGFYRHLGLAERPAPDNVRQHFYVKGPEARAAFLKHVLDGFRP